MAAVKAFADGNGPPPNEYLEVTAAEQFGWTWDELDTQDEGRTMVAMSIKNLVAGYARVLRAIEVHQPQQLTASDWAAYRAVTEATSNA